MNKSEIIHCQDLDECYCRTAALIEKIAQKCITDRGYFTLVLSGGGTPRQLHAQMSTPPFSTRFPWRQTFIFWGDERLVGNRHPDSNYAMAVDTLLSKVAIPAANIYRMENLPEGPEEAARTHEEKIRFFFAGKDSRPGRSESSLFFPRFDLILLGMGTDGHTASLFPGQAALNEKKRWVTAVEYAGASPPVPRLTLTLPVLNSAANVLFLISGPEKLSIMRRIVASPETAGQRYPAALVRPQGRLIWIAA